MNVKVVKIAASNDDILEIIMLLKAMVNTSIEVVFGGYENDEPYGEVCKHCYAEKSYSTFDSNGKPDVLTHNEDCSVLKAEARIKKLSLLGL